MLYTDAKVYFMKEVTFIRRNIDKWKRTEKVVDKAHVTHPDILAEAYIELTADLAFSQTHYPHSRITIYLNNLASSLHNVLYRNKRQKWSRIPAYWAKEVPMAMFGARKEIWTSLIVFLIAVFIGALSSLHDEGFVRQILGNHYVDMTLRNIAAGEPMGVYGSSREVPMFLGITLNNIVVSFNVFIFGLFTSLAVGFFLVYNGMIIGAFLVMFFQNNLLGEAILTIMLHGTLELWAIIVAGAAGIVMGNGWLFPGTYSRGVSFRHGAKKGVKIVIGLIPIFIIAGFIESFITRHTQLPFLLRLSVILFSLAFILFYYIYLPNKIHYGNKSKSKNRFLRSTLIR